MGLELTDKRLELYFSFLDFFKEMSVSSQLTAVVPKAEACHCTTPGGTVHKGCGTDDVPGCVHSSAHGGPGNLHRCLLENPELSIKVHTLL